LTEEADKLEDIYSVIDSLSEQVSELDRSVDRITKERLYIDADVSGGTESSAEMVYRLLMEACIQKNVHGRSGETKIQALKGCHERTRSLIKEAEIPR